MSPPSTTTSQGALAVFDRQTALKRLGNSTELFNAMVGFFCEDHPALMESIQKAFQQRDASAVARNAHALKGLASNVEATAVVNYARQVELSAKAGDLDTAEERFATLRREVDSLSEALKCYLNQESR